MGADFFIVTTLAMHQAHIMPEKSSKTQPGIRNLDCCYTMVLWRRQRRGRPKNQTFEKSVGDHKQTAICKLGLPLQWEHSLCIMRVTFSRINSICNDLSELYDNVSELHTQIFAKVWGSSHCRGITTEFANTTENCFQKLTALFFI